MAAVQTAPETGAQLVGAAPPSPAGPLEAGVAGLAEPPLVPLARWRNVLAISQREIEYVFRWRRELGEVFRFAGVVPGKPAITSHPDHVRSLFTADPIREAPSLTGESPLLPIVGPNSVLTANGTRHMRQRKLLLPSFHGDAIERYVQMITRVTEREIARWPRGRPFALAPRMQAITLDVIMSGILGIEGVPRAGTPEWGLRTAVRELAMASTRPIGQLGMLMNVGRERPIGIMRAGLAILDRSAYAVIAARRRSGELERRTDILSLIMQAQTEDGEPLSDRELRDELLTIVLAGFETTANQLAWTWERLVRSPAAHLRLLEAVRSDSEPEEWVEATIQESMRSRPVIPAIGRRVLVPWRLGDYAVEAGTPIVMSILLLHHREDLYPDPFSFRPERWLGRRPGTYEWIPFGGGTRRCLGAALAMAEQRVVLTEMARRLEIHAADPEPERARTRNVTMIPRRGARVVIADAA